MGALVQATRPVTGGSVNHSEIVSFLWGVADLIRDSCKRGKYQESSFRFNRYFYCYTPPRPREEIEADIRGIEQDILRMLAEVTGAEPTK